MEVTIDEDGIARCSWGTAAPDYIDYHDTEWGFPVDDDRLLFEKLCLEGFQAGLSWLTILRKRESFRSAFYRFDFARVAEMGPADVERLLADASIVRHRGKIESTINNAAKAITLREEFGSLGGFFWSFEPAARPVSGNLPATTTESTALSKDLKRRGFSFVGPTTAYAFMQAMGIVNDHVEGCYVYAQVEEARGSFARPS